jgi:hypothetical protein
MILCCGRNWFRSYKNQVFQIKSQFCDKKINSFKIIGLNDSLEAIEALVFVRFAGGVEEESDPLMMPEVFPISLIRASGEPGLTRIP